MYVDESTPIPHPKIKSPIPGPRQLSLVFDDAICDILRIVILPPIEAIVDIVDIFDLLYIRQYDT